MKPFKIGKENMAKFPFKLLAISGQLVGGHCPADKKSMFVKCHVTGLKKLFTHNEKD